MLSGGLDSTVLAHSLQQDGISFDSIFFDANKKSTMKELEHARYNGLKIGKRFELVDISAVNKSFVGYVTSNYVLLDELDRGGDTHITPGFSDSVGPTGFPIILSIASYLGQISQRKNIYIGITKEQADLVPTTRKFFESWGETLSLLNGSNFPIKIETPFIDMTKSEIITLGKKLKVDFSRSWSCMYDLPAQCGTCPRCIERKGAFKKAKVKDNTVYL